MKGVLGREWLLPEDRAGAGIQPPVASLLPASSTGTTRALSWWEWPHKPGAPWGCAVLSLHICAWSHAQTLLLLSLVFRPPARAEISIITALAWRHPGTQISLSKHTQERRKATGMHPDICLRFGVLDCPGTWAPNKLALPWSQPQEASRIQTTFMVLPTAIEPVCSTSCLFMLRQRTRSSFQVNFRLCSWPVSDWLAIFCCCCCVCFN